MELKNIADINQYVGSSINPHNTPEIVYELYSVPSFDSQYPEILKGSDIGSTKATVEGGDVLICKINPRINRVWVVKHHTEYPLLASSEWIVVRNSEIDSNYLKWYFSSPPFRKLLVSQVAGIGGSLTRAQPKQVAKYPVPVPDFSTQQAIASILDKLDYLISLRKQQLVKLDELVKARFVEIFGGIEETVSLSHYISALLAGKSLAGEEECVNKVLKTGAATYDEFDPSQVKNLPADYIPQTDHLLRTGDVIISRMNTAELVGAAAYVWEAPINTYLPDRLWRAELKNNVCPIFVWQSLIQATTKESIRKIASGTSGSMKNISKPGLLRIHVKKVGFDIQEKFSDFVVQVHRQKLTIQQSLDKLEVLRKSLMQEYFG